MLMHQMMNNEYKVELLEALEKCGYKKDVSNLKFRSIN